MFFLEAAKEIIIKEGVEFIQKKMDQTSYDIDGIKKLFKTYIAYFFKNTNIFRFFYLYQLSKPINKAEETEEQPDYDQMWKETFKGFVMEGVIDEKHIEVLAKIFICNAWYVGFKLFIL